MLTQWETLPPAIGFRSSFLSFFHSSSCLLPMCVDLFVALDHLLFCLGLWETVEKLRYVLGWEPSTVSWMSILILRKSVFVQWLGLDYSHYERIIFLLLHGSLQNSGITSSISWEGLNKYCLRRDSKKKMKMR